MIAFFSGLWGKVAIAAGFVLGLLVLVGKLVGLGRDQERAKQLQRTNEAKERIADADARGPRTADAVDKRLRDGTF